MIPEIPHKPEFTEKPLDGPILGNVISNIFSNFNKHWNDFQTGTWNKVQQKTIVDISGLVYKISYIDLPTGEDLNINVLDKEGRIYKNLHIRKDMSLHTSLYKQSDEIYISTQTHRLNLNQDTPSAVKEALAIMQKCNLISQRESKSILSIIQ